MDFETPGRVYTNEQTRGMFAPRSNDDVVEELRQMRADNKALRSEIAAMRRDTRKTADTLNAVANAPLSFSTTPS